MGRLVHGGRPHGPEDACKDVHCHGCGRDGPRRFAACCGECFHAWRWGWLLSLADARLHWALGQRMGAWDEPIRWWRRIRLRRPSRIYVCPCCSHDL